MKCWPDDPEPPPRIPMWLAVVLLCVASPLIGIGLAAGTNYVILEWMR